ncbi:MAG: hypothetical protein ACTSXL_04705 [Alphaproteobacteria bacterium]
MIYNFQKTIENTSKNFGNSADNLNCFDYITHPLREGQNSSAILGRGKIKKLLCVFIFISSSVFGQGFLDNLIGNSNDKKTQIEDSLLADKLPIIQSFDIAGISLEATYPYLKSYIFPKMGYSIIEMKTKIPVLYKHNYNYSCRQKGAKTPKAIEGCIIGTAQKNKMEYVEKIKLARFKTGEEIEIWFTSNLTEHLVYKVIYRNDVNEIEGIGATYVYQQMEKRKKFWVGIIKKYKRPNIIEEAKWGDPTDPSEPFLQAFYGKLKLEYPALLEKDKVKIATTAEELFETKDYKF